MIYQALAELAPTSIIEAVTAQPVDRAP